MFKLVLLKTEHGVDTNRMHIRNVQEMQILISVLIMWFLFVFFRFNFFLLGKNFLSCFG